MRSLIQALLTATILIFTAAMGLAAAAPSPNAAAAQAAISAPINGAAASESSYHLSVIDWLMIAAYMVGMLAIGWVYSLRTKTTDDYLLGGRAMKPWAVGLSLFAALISTLSYLAVPGEMIAHGPLLALATVLAVPVSIAIVGWLLIPHILQRPITSAYEILEHKLGLSVRLVGSSFFVALRLLWMATIVYGTAQIALTQMAGLEDWTVPYLCVVLGIITVVYTSIGGFGAVVFTDVVQTLLLFAGAIFALVLITSELGGVGAWWPAGWEPHWDDTVIFYGPDARFTLVGLIVYTCLWYICTAGSDQLAVQRYLATPDVRAAQRMYIISMVTTVLVTVLLSALGLALLAYFRLHPELLPTPDAIERKADALFPRYTLLSLPRGIAGLVVAGLLSAAMSSLSSGLSSACSVISVDFIDRFRQAPLSERAHVRQTRLISWLLGGLVVAMSTAVGYVHGNLLELCFKIVNLFVAPLFGMFAMAMWVHWATPLGTLVGAAAGLAVALVTNFSRELGLDVPIGIDWAMPLSLALQMIIGMAVSAVQINRRTHSASDAPSED